MEQTNISPITVFLTRLFIVGYTAMKWLAIVCIGLRLFTIFIDQITTGVLLILILSPVISIFFNGFVRGVFVADYFDRHRKR